MVVVAAAQRRWTVAWVRKTKPARRATPKQGGGDAAVAVNVAAAAATEVDGAAVDNG